MTTPHHSLRKVFATLYFGTPLPRETQIYWSLVMGDTPIPEYPFDLKDTWDFKNQLLLWLTQWLQETWVNWDVPTLWSLQTRQSLLEALQQSFRVDKPPLQSTCLLYVTVGRSEFEFRLAELASLTGYSNRTLERRFQDGVFQFYGWLHRQREAEAQPAKWSPIGTNNPEDFDVSIFATASMEVQMLAQKLVWLEQEVKELRDRD